MTPKELGYRFPAEWEQQSATWLSWAHKEASWPDKFEPIPDVYTGIVKTIARFQHVNINVADEAMLTEVTVRLTNAGVDASRFSLYIIPTNDAWCRDHGPAFVVNPAAENPLAIVDWGYNAWGGKYPPFDLDDIVPTRIAEKRGLPVFYPGIVMEGGAIDVNGKGCLLTTKACLLNENRNPLLDQEQIEQYLCDYYGQEKILWLEDGIAEVVTKITLRPLEERAELPGQEDLVDPEEHQPPHHERKVLGVFNRRVGAMFAGLDRLSVRGHPP